MSPRVTGRSRAGRKEGAGRKEETGWQVPAFSQRLKCHSGTNEGKENLEVKPREL